MSKRAIERAGGYNSVTDGWTRRDNATTGGRAKSKHDKNMWQ